MPSYEMRPFVRVPILRVDFEIELEREELPAFRGAICRVAGYDLTLFHNHMARRKYVFRYPLIQYRWLRGRPIIVALGEGCAQVRQLFSRMGDHLEIYGEKRPIRVERAHGQMWTFRVWHQMWFSYRLIHWLPFNDENWKRWQNLSSEEEQRTFLERILIGNFLTMAKGLAWHVPERIRVEIQHWTSPKPVTYKPGIWKHSTSVVFRTNLRLPYWIGVGKGASLGFGTIAPHPCT